MKKTRKAEEEKMTNNNKLSPKLIIFDFDGTLADTVGSITEAVNDALAENGMPLRDEEYVRRSIGNGARTLCTRILPDDKRDDETVSRTLAAYNAAYGRSYLHVDGLYPGMLESLGELKRRGYLLAVFSNKHEDYLTELCQALIPAGWISAEAGQNESRPIKPDPAAALEICRRLGVEPHNAVMVGDGETDVELSLRGGLIPLSVTWGFRSREALEAAGGRIFIDSPSELVDIFG